MWTCVTVVYLIAGAVFTARLLSSSRVGRARDSAIRVAKHCGPKRTHRGWRRSECPASPQLPSNSLLPGRKTRRLRGSTLLSDYWALTKPEVNFLILITTFVGFYLGCGSEARPFSFAGLFNTLLGTLLVASGTGTLNQYIERKFDAQMRRTARRPAAAGRLKPSRSPGLRNRVGSDWQHLSRDSRQPARQCARNFHVADLSVLVHPAEAKNTNVRSRRSFSRCHAAAHWLGRSLRAIEYRGGDAVRHALSVAVSTFHGNRMDVPRRLRPRRLFGSAQGQCESSFRDSGNPIAADLLSSLSASCNLRHGTRRFFIGQ